MPLALPASSAQNRRRRRLQDSWGAIEAVPAVSLPRPAPHVPQSVQDASPLSPDLKVCAGHAVHVASAVGTFEAVKYWPAGHVVFLAVQAVAELVPVLK